MKTARVAIASFFLLSCAAAWAAADGSDDIVAGFKAAAQAQAAASAAARRAEVQVAARAPFLWRVDGGAAPAYLFGTSHDIAAKNLDGAVFAKLAQSSAIVLEKSSDSNIMHERPELFWLPEGQSLDTLLGPRLWTVLKERVDPTVPDKDLRKYRPFLAFMYFKPVGDVSSSAASMDDELAAFAARQGMRIEGLESSEEIYRYADRAFTIDYLRNQLYHNDDMSALVARARQAYVSGDENACLAVDAEASRFEAPRVSRILVDERNANWLPRIESRIRTGGVFIAVGLNHLIGEGHLLDLLRRDGYVLTRMPSR